MSSAIDVNYEERSAERALPAHGRHEKDSGCKGAERGCGTGRIMPLSCRFYSQKYPEPEDVVMVNVRQIAEMGAYVRLLEYNDIEGMILLSELSRRRIRSINKLIRVGRSECVVVIRVDKDKGYIDLSKRRVSPEDITKCEEKFARGRAVNSILRHVAETLKFETDEQLEELYRKTAWYFDDKFKKPTASYDIFKLAVTDISVLNECNIDPETKEVLLTNIKHRLTPQAVKIRSGLCSLSSVLPAPGITRQTAESMLLLANSRLKGSPASGSHALLAAVILCMLALRYSASTGQQVTLAGITIGESSQVPSHVLKVMAKEIKKKKLWSRSSCATPCRQK